MAIRLIHGDAQSTRVDATYAESLPRTSYTPDAERRGRLVAFTIYHWSEHRNEVGVVLGALMRGGVGGRMPGERMNKAHTTILRVYLNL